MKNILIVFFALFASLFYAQDLEKIAKEIKDEGVELYRSEMASWYGTDIFMANYKDRENIGGYFSYIDQQVPKCIFFSKNNKVLATIAFPANYYPENAKLDMTERDFTPGESDYFTIRQNALERIKNDTIFKHYKNTNLNIVPIIQNNVKKVYVLTGPSVDNLVIFGNDYLITFNDKSEVKTIEKLHKGMIVQNIYDEKVGKTVCGVHSHVLENWQTITPTDVCTLMLYQKFTNWENYMVVSKKYTSIWDSKNNVMVMKSEDYNKISKKDKKEKNNK